MEQQETTDFLVIGAGLAGLAFGQDIAQSGATVRLIDKGRGIGGRMATRRVGSTEAPVRIDHGAQFFTARGQRLTDWVERSLAEGWLAVWSHGFPLWKDGGLVVREPGHARFAPFKGMNEVARRLGDGLDIVTSATVNRIEKDGDRFTAFTEEGRTFQGRTLILNLPPVQLLNVARNLLSEAMVDALNQVEFLPAWTMLGTLEKDIDGADWPAVEFDHPVLGWVSRDHTKRGSGATPALVVHGAGSWSREHLEDTPDAVKTALGAALAETIEQVTWQTVQVHRWRYALPTRTIPATFLWDSDLRIGCCGDWCNGPRVEGALESGWQLAGVAQR